MLLTVEEVAKMKGVKPNTVKVAGYRGHLNFNYTKEKRNNYTRRVMYIVNDDKLKEYNPKVLNANKVKKFVKVKAGDAWKFRFDAMGQNVQIQD